jgi:hypothetical protein
MPRPPPARSTTRSVSRARRPDRRCDQSSVIRNQSVRRTNRAQHRVPTRLRHCEEPEGRRSNPGVGARGPGLLCCARNDGGLPTSLRSPVVLYRAVRGRTPLGKEAIDMRRILVAAGLALLTTSSAWAQSAANCDQIRQAVAQYGYAAARAHAMRTYGADAVRNGDKCLGRGGRVVRHVRHQRARQHR